jgi:hypothetical protein
MVGKYNYENILFIRTPTTGDFLDKLMVNNSNITRIMYETYKIVNYSLHPSTHLVDYSQLPQLLLAMNKRFDFICIDTFHAFTTSQNDLHLMSLFLTLTAFLRPQESS